MPRAGKRQAKRPGDDAPQVEPTCIEPIDDAPKRPNRGAPKDGPARRQAILEVLASGKSVTTAAAVAGIDRTTAYDWYNSTVAKRTKADGSTVDPRHQRPDFADEWDAAIEAGNDLLEDEAHRRAHEGVLKPVFQGGECVGHIREFSDALMTISLKARRPHRYKERQEITGANGSPLVPAAVEVTFVSAK